MYLSQERNAMKKYISNIYTGISVSSILWQNIRLGDLNNIGILVAVEPGSWLRGQQVWFLLRASVYFLAIFSQYFLSEHVDRKETFDDSSHKHISSIGLELKLKDLIFLAGIFKSPVSNAITEGSSFHVWTQFNS